MDVRSFIFIKSASFLNLSYIRILQLNFSKRVLIFDPIDPAPNINTFEPFNKLT